MSQHLPVDLSIPPKTRPYEEAHAPLSILPDDIFAGGGEMGASMRAIDWAATSLGPVESWSQPLRSAVSLSLASRFPILLFYGPELLILYNDASIPIFGRKHPEALGRPSREVWPEIWHIIGPMLEGVLTTGQATWSDDLQLVLDRAGYLEETYFTFSYSPIGLETGRVDGIFAAVNFSTEHVIGERRLRTLRELAEHVGDARSPEEACRQAARTFSANPADVPFTLMYQLDERRTQASLIGASGLEEGGAASPRKVRLEEAGAHGWPLARVVATGRMEVVPHVRELFGNLPGGAWDESPHSAVLLPISQPGQKEPYGVLVAGVSPRRRLDESYRGFLELATEHVASAVANAQAYEAERRRAEQLAELNRAKTTFFSNISHEFRTPLSLMLATLEDALASPQKCLASEELSHVHRNGVRLLKLVNTLLDFSRIEAGRMQASYVSTDLSTLTADLASTFRSAMERAGLRLVVDCPPLPAPTWVDPELWEKIVLNLISNAFKFTFEGEVEVALRWRGPYVELTVRDTGTGITPEELPRIFERFHRVEGARGRSFEGTGIGLALVQELVKLHGGTVRVQSELDRGTTFTVSIPTGNAHLPPERLGTARALVSTAVGASPFLQETAGWTEAAPSPAAVCTPSVTTVPRAAAPLPCSVPREARILLADDNADMCSYTERLLRAQGWEVEAVRDGAAAFEAALARPPDLVLSDVMMPRLDGFGLLRALREDSRTHTVPIILLSARAGEEATVEGLGAGADDYLTKPFSARELVARVGAALTIARMRQEALRREQQYVAEMEAKQRLLDSVLQQMPAGFILTEPSGRMTFHNHQMEGMMRGPLFTTNSLEEFIHYRGFHLDGRPIRPEEWPLARSLLHGEELVDQELLMVRQDGTQALWRVRTSPIRDHENRIIAGVAICQDVTQQKEQEAELRRRVEFEQQIVGIVSHDLRNPINAITLAARTLLWREGLDARAVKSANRILSSAERATRMIRDLLDFTQARLGGGIPLERRPTDLRLLVQQVLEEVGVAWPERRIEVSQRGNTWGEWDSDRMAQVVSNLVTNALKYSPTDTPVRVDLCAEGEAAVLSVHNEGAPIPPDLIPRLFEPLQRGAREMDRASRSIGLGLYIVKHLVEEHGGTVSAQSSQGRGTTFIVRLPREPPPH
ncbi:response regulator [Archangium violaceum]|uniref:ATP-binding protein n=1 Tax=Archangium violaceum TaxID=83451 RepID=UPI0019522A34|nr:ATP-binding protein [Archangium violaceum]QRO01235.1 response regulator [Archangium violaceum]